MSLDQITKRRILNFIREFKTKTGELPTFRDLEEARFSDEIVKQAVKDGLIEELFVTLTSGTIVKGFRVV